MSSATDEPPVDSSFILARGAVLAGLCKFVPIPVLDDILLRRAHQHLIASLLRAHGLDYDVGHLRPLYADTRGCLASVSYFILCFPFVLAFKLLKKLFRTFFFFLTIRDAALQVGYALSLGRSVERCLLDGRIPTPSADTPSPEEQSWQAADRVRRSLKEAFAGSDWRMVCSFISGVFRGAKGLVSLGRSVTLDLFGRTAPSKSAADRDFSDAPQESRAEVDSLADKLAEAMLQQEVKDYLSKFDARFDSAWSS